MPSDAKKKKEQQKKDARKNKNNKKVAKQENDGDQVDENNLDENNTSDVENNGTESEQTTSQNGENGETVVSKAQNGSGGPADRSFSEHFDELERKLHFLTLLDKQNADNRACTGVLASHPNGRDVHIHQFSLTFYGQELLVDAQLELNMGRRYGIIGLNGSGKSTMLTAIGKKKFRFRLVLIFIIYHVKYQLRIKLL